MDNVWWHLSWMDNCCSPISLALHLGSSRIWYCHWRLDGCGVGVKGESGATSTGTLSQESTVCHLAASFYSCWKALQHIEDLRVCFSVLLRGKCWNTAFCCRPGLKLILVRNTKWVVGLKPVFYYWSYSSQGEKALSKETTELSSDLPYPVDCILQFSDSFPYFTWHGFFFFFFLKRNGNRLSCDIADRFSSALCPLSRWTPALALTLCLFPSSLWWKLPHDWRHLQQPWLPGSLSF